MHIAERMHDRVILFITKQSEDSHIHRPPERVHHARELTVSADSRGFAYRGIIEREQKHGPWKEDEDAGTGVDKD